MLTPTQIAQIETLASQGMPFKRIQRMTGISRNTIKKYVHRANEPLTERQKVRNCIPSSKNQPLTVDFAVNSGWFLLDGTQQEQRPS